MMSGRFGLCDVRFGDLVRGNRGRNRVVVFDVFLALAVRWAAGGVGLRSAGRRWAVKFYFGEAEAPAVPSVAGAGMPKGGG